MTQMNRGTLMAGRFLIEGLARVGGMGAVYRAMDLVTGATVALKVLVDGEPTAAQRFAREAELLAELESPEIVRYVAHGTTHTGDAYLAMEWLEGEDLADRLDRGTLSISEALEVTRAVARGLAVAHARGVVHRDVKPSNVFLVDGDPSRAKVLDFGVSVATRSARRLTAFGLTIGTLGYMAPEQAYAGNTIDARADVFALGCVLFECLTGRGAFDGASDVEIIARSIAEEAPSVADLRPGVPAELVALVARMLTKDPEDRFEDAAAVLEALDAIESAPKRRLQLVTSLIPLPLAAGAPPRRTFIGFASLSPTYAPAFAVMVAS
jgi:serine/threonine protein kinase